MASSSEPDAEITPSAFPAQTRTATALINNISTVASRTLFSDKILITVTQGGKLAHWTHTPLTLSLTDPSSFTNTTVTSSNLHTEYEGEEQPSSDLLPNHKLTATTILGGTIPELDILAQTLATQIASAIKTRDAREERTVVLGTGLDKSMSAREPYSELVGLLFEVL